MAAPKTTKPRVDTIIRHIEKGSYDDELVRLQEAINDRNEVRKEAVNRLVEEVYGEGHYVTSPMKVVRSSTPGTYEVNIGEKLPGEVLPGESPHVRPIEEDDQYTDDDESRSPIISGLESKEPPNEVITG